jgi:hypothetical protein
MFASRGASIPLQRSKTGMQGTWGFAATYPPFEGEQHYAAPIFSHCSRACRGLISARRKRSGGDAANTWYRNHAYTDERQTRLVVDEVLIRQLELQHAKLAQGGTVSD